MRALPTWRNPVGEGAKRTRTIAFEYTGLRFRFIRLMARCLGAIRPQSTKRTRLGGNEDFATISRAIKELLDQGLCPLSLGGDHSVTYPIIRAFAAKYPNLTIIHFDAHPDLYEEFEGSRLSHACPFARIMEERLAKRLIQVGIRTLNHHQRVQAEKFGVEILPMSLLPACDRVKVSGPVYISFDMDVLDPAFAPGVSHWEPGGMTVREAISHLHAVSGEIVGADVVELNPARDTLGISAVVAAKIVKEILGKMLTE